MDLTYTEEQELFRRSVRDFVSDRVTAGRLAEIADGEDGWDPALWKEAAAMGLAAVSVPEDRGGAGMTFVEEAIAAEELGRGVFPGPWLGSVVLALPALSERPELLEEVARGGRIATVVPAGGRNVPDLAAADLLIVEADGRLVTVDKDVVTWRQHPTVDGTRRLGDVEVEGIEGDPLAEGDRFASVMTAVRLRGLAALASEAVGVADRALEVAVGYAKEREQFGRRIGAFQAVSHQLADTYMEIELARSLSLWAALTIAEGDPDVEMATASAKSYAADAAVAACERAIQVHGGIGFTWEHDLHRSYKRALWIRAFGTSGADLRAEIAARVVG